MFLSSISLIITNIVPLFGAIFFDWSIYSILIAYWIENLIIGYFTYIKIPLSLGNNKENKILRLFNLPPFQENMVINRFLRDYMFFCIVHGVLLFVFFFIDVKFEIDIIPNILLMTVLLFISHWISYRSNFMGKKEYLRISPSQQVVMPYSRIMIMHLVVLMGGLIVENNGYKLVAVGFLVILKTAADLGSHLFEHNNGQI